MGLFDRKKEGGLMDVIRCDQENYLVWKWRPSGEVNSTKKENSIRWGSSLRVKDGEVAVFFYKQNDGIQHDFIIGPYDGKIETVNFPILTSIVGSLWGGDSPFQAEIYFMNLQGNNQIRFAVPYFDVADSRFPDFTIPVAVRGSLTFNLTDYKKFIKLNRLIDFDLEKFGQQIKGAVVKYVKNFVINCSLDNNIPIMQLERKVLDISDMVHICLKPQFEADFGVNLKRLDISAIEIDKESENYAEFVRLTKEQQMCRAEIDTGQYERVSKLSAESQFIQAHTVNQQAEILKNAAQSMGQMGEMNMGGGDGMNPVGMMIGMSMGGALGGQMTGMMNNLSQMPQPQQLLANTNTVILPPIATIKTYFVVINGQQIGPNNLQQMQLMIQNGLITTTTLVWTQGMAQWAQVGTIPELMQLFVVSNQTPPPIPPSL